MAGKEDRESVQELIEAGVGDLPADVDRLGEKRDGVMYEPGVAAEARDARRPLSEERVGGTPR